MSLSRWRKPIAAAFAARDAGGRAEQIARERRARLRFDDTYYTETYADVSDPGFDRFSHFMEHGWREGRNASAAFDTLYYRDVHLGGAAENPLLHFVDEGEALGLKTRPAAHDTSYLEVQRALCSSYFADADFRAWSGYDGEDALGHYLREGWRKAVPPSLLFDPARYVSQHCFILHHDISPLYHFASQRRFRDEGSPLTLDLFVGPPPGTLLERVVSPTHVLTPPKLVELEPVPNPLRQRLDAIWRNGKTGGEPRSTYRFRNVYVTGEGLVFTNDASVIDVTRYGHTDDFIRKSALAIATAHKRGHCETIEAGILAKTRGAPNYGHFILEMLPRAWFARTRLQCSFPAIIQGAGSQIEHISREALRCVGFGPNDIIARGRDPIFVRELIVVDGLVKHPTYLSPTILDCFDEIASRIEAGSFEKVYAARGAGTVRDFLDESAVAAQVAAAGFHRATTGEMPFAAQVALFKGASHVFGIGGAALTNLLFCRRGTRVTLISPSSASEVLFWTIAELRGLAYEEVRCREVGPQKGSLAWNRSIDVQPADLARLLT